MVLNSGVSEKISQEKKKLFLNSSKKSSTLNSIYNKYIDA